MSDETTIKAIVNKTYKAHLKDIRDRIGLFKNELKENISPRLRFESFRRFLGETDFVLDHASLKVLKYLVKNAFVSLERRNILGMKSEDDVETRYHMESYVRMMSILLDDIENFVQYSDDPTFSIKIEQQLPVLLCHKCGQKELDSKAYPLAIGMMGDKC